MPSLVRTPSRIAAAGECPASSERSEGRIRSLPTLPLETAQRIGRPPRPDVLGRRATPPLLRRQRVDRVGDAVVGPIGRDAARAAGHRAGDAPRDVVRLRAGVDEHHDVERAARRRDQPLRNLERGLVQIAHVRVQPPRLADDRLDDARMAVAHDRHVVVRIQVAAARRRRSARRRRRARGAEARGREAVIAGPAPLRDARPAAARSCRGPALDRPAAAATSSQPAPAAARSAATPRSAVSPMSESGSSYSAARDAGTTTATHIRAARSSPRIARSPGLERRDLLVAVDQRAARRGRTRRPTPTIHDGFQHGRQIDHQRRPAGVAEVDDPGDLPRVVDEHVRGAQVCVDDLRAQAGPHRRDDLLVAIERPLDQLATLRVANRARASAAEAARAGHPRASPAWRPDARSHAAPYRRARPWFPNRGPPRRSGSAPTTDVRPGSRSYIRA